MLANFLAGVFGPCTLTGAKQAKNCGVKAMRCISTRFASQPIRPNSSVKPTFSQIAREFFSELTASTGEFWALTDENEAQIRGMSS